MGKESIEKSKEGKIFELKDGDWKWTKENLEKIHKKDHHSTFIERAAETKIIFPEKASELNLNEEDWKETEEVLYKDKRYRDYFKTAANAKILFPEKILEEISRESYMNEWFLSERAFKEQEKELLKYLDREDDFLSFSEKATALKIIHPERLPKVHVVKKYWPSIIEGIEKHRENGDWWKFSQQAANAKIIFPEKASELNLNENDWQGMNHILEECRDKDDLWKSFSQQAKNMKILAADKVEVDENGLKVE